MQGMLDSMTREPFYTSGHFAEDRLELSIAWTCHKGSFADCLPIWNETRDIVLFFTGEDFADAAIIAKLKTQGHQFDDGAGYLVHLYEETGIEFLERLNGWFSGVLVDLRQRKAVLFNDRYGLRRIYYHENDSALYFSSEAKALLKVVPETRRLDARSLGELVSCGCVLQNRSLFSGVSLLPAASRWTFSPGQRLRKEVYFKRESWESQGLLPENEFYDQLKETFSRILPRYFRDRQTIGMSLTGGVDGRMIMAWAQASPGTLPCYTFGGTYRDCNDVRLARRIARMCRQPHQVIQVDGEFLRDFSGLAAKAIRVSDGAMDITGSAELYVNRIARKIAPVRLTGNYGSELVRGNVAFKPETPPAGLFASEFEQQVRDGSATYAEETQCHPISFIAFKQVPWHHHARFSIEQSQLTPRSPFLDNDLVGLMYRAPRHLVLSKEPSFRLIAEGNEALGRLPTDRGLRYKPIPVASRVQNSYQEFTAKAEYAYDYGMPQWLARLDRTVSSLRLERLFLGRHKFCHFRIWYRDQLAECLKELLLDRRSRERPWLNGGRMEAMVTSHTAGRANFTSEIHRVLALELIQRELIEKN